jgi:hypothetical protein
MKWNTPDWWFGLVAGVLFGLFLALNFLERIFAPGSDAGSYIGLFGLVGYLIVVHVRRWRLRPKNPSASTHESPC